MGDTCSGLMVHWNDPSHPESAAVQNNANPQLAIDYVALGEPPFANLTNNFMFKMMVTNLTSVPPNSRWRMFWDSFAASLYPPVPNPDPSGAPIVAQQFFVGMRSDANSAVTVEYGIIGTGTVAVALGLPLESLIGTPLAQSNMQADGTITIYVPKSAVGNPQPGDLLGAVNGRTFTGDTAQTMNIECSTSTSRLGMEQLG